jgi:uncharacterized protein (TIRG00374 family)
MIDPVQTSSLPEPRARGRQTLIWVVKILVSGGLLYLLLGRVDLARLWQTARTASVAWLAGALLLYLINMVIASWRWWLLARAQHLAVAFRSLLASYLVATFFNNFLPSNIGGDVIRIRDTARAAGSKTLATTIVLVDRGIGLMGLIFVAALGSTFAARMSDKIGPVGPGILWAVLVAAFAVGAPAVLMPRAVAALLRPLRALHQEWFEERITRLTTALAKFRDAPQALGACFAGAILVQGILVFFYAVIALSLHLHVPLAHLAIVVPISFIVQMLPVSVNGFGVREATFGFYLTRLGLPLEAALALSFIGAVLVMLFSTSGAFVYLVRRK